MNGILDVDPVEFLLKKIFFGVPSRIQVIRIPQKKQLP